MPAKKQSKKKPRKYITILAKLRKMHHGYGQGPGEPEAPPTNQNALSASVVGKGHAMSYSKGRIAKKDSGYEIKEGGWIGVPSRGGWLETNRR